MPNSLCKLTLDFVKLLYGDISTLFIAKIKQNLRENKFKCIKIN